MRKTWLLLVAALLVRIAVAHAQGQKPLDIYFIDTEGGQATLFVSPTGESMLVDTGFAGNSGRDADRISGVMKQAGLQQLDFLVITHYHGDHVGNAAELSTRFPIRRYIDHGPYSVELQPNRATGFLSYLPVREKAHATQAKPGDKVPVAGLDVQIVSASGELITAPLAGAGAPNPRCRDFKPMVQDPVPENFESLGLVVRYGTFRLLDLGDLTWNQEHDLVCPNNLLGAVDVYHTTRHGDPHSGAPVMVHALNARVAVMNNGAKKGGSPEAWQIVRDSPGLQDFWQLHYSEAGGAAHNSPEPFIANLNETDHGHNLKMSVRPDGSFTMTNERTGFKKEYQAAKGASTRR